MRLLQLQDDGDFSLVQRVGNNIPPYAILSHTWGPDDEEITFRDMIESTGKNKIGYQKLILCGKRAIEDNLAYFWIDTCCIDKSSSAELSEAINSMFRWYCNAAKCYVYLSDVSTTAASRGSVTFQNSRWFSRGWTLQELLAPTDVEFLSMEGDPLGTKSSRVQEIAEITSIPTTALQGRSMSQFSVDERMVWARKRETTREEDIAYSLLGIFNIHMPPIYGEGKNNALRRLKKEIRESSEDAAAAIPQGMQYRNSTYHISFPKNRYFVGRKNELAVLKQKLMVDRECQNMSIVGLGGTGKTQIALQFAYTVKETWPEFSVFWLPAISMESFEQACGDIARVLHMPQAAGEDEDAKELVKNYLSSEQAGRWLLVLDNADDAEILFGKGQSKGIVDYLPKSEEGIILYTTRALEVAVSLTRGDVMELKEMNRQDAADFLEKLLIRKELLRDGAATTGLLDELTCLPLAIAQAAAYLNINKMSITQYLRLLQNTEQDIVSLISWKFRDNTRYKLSANAVATTWAVSFSQIRERDAAAADLLAFLSCVEWKAIPRSLLPNVQPEERREEAIGALCGYSFLTRRKENNRIAGNQHEAIQEEEWYDMHRLVHLATGVWVAKHGVAAEVKENAVRHVANIFPSTYHTYRAVWRSYLPHTLRLLENAQDCNIEMKSTVYLLVGRCLQFDGRIREAIKWLRECCRLREGLDEEDQKRLSSQHELALAYDEDGQVQKAVDLLEHVVAVQERVLEVEHPSRLSSQHELAAAYQADGQIQKAVTLLEHVVTTQDKVLVEEDPDRFPSQHELSIAYHADGQIQKAVALLEHLVVMREKVQVEEDPGRLASQHELAAAYLADGQIQKAVILLEHVVAVRDKVQVEEHPDTLASQHELARVYQADGKVKKAVNLLEHVVAVREKVQAKEHRYRLASQRALARAYQADGQVQKAVNLLEYVVAVHQQVVKEEHPGLLTSQHMLAEAYHADGQVQNAVNLLEYVAAVREEVLREEHPDRLMSQHELARAYHADGQVQKAGGLLEHVVAVRERVLREEHPDRLASQHELARVYQADGQVQKAGALLEHVVAIKSKTLREHHPSLIESQKALAELYARAWS